jgi:hypothetical protein
VPPEDSSIMLGIVIVAGACSVFWFIVGLIVGLAI